MTFLSYACRGGNLYNFNTSTYSTFPHRKLPSCKVDLVAYFLPFFGVLAMSSSISVTLIRNLNHKDSRTAVLRPSSLKASTVSDSSNQLHPSEKNLYQLAVEASGNKFKLRAKDILLFDSCGTLIRPSESSENSFSKKEPNRAANLASQCRDNVSSHPSVDHPTILPSLAFRSGAKIYVSAGEDWIRGKAAGGSKWSESAPTSENQSATSQQPADVFIIANQTPIDAAAVQQLKWTAALPGVFLAVGLPDLHAGPTCPIGTAVATSRLLYPALVGPDIGCGIRFDQTSLTKAASERSRVVDRWANAVDLEGGWDGDVEAYILASGLTPTRFDKSSLGTIGKGNHFAELQAIESIEDPVAAEFLGLDPAFLYLCVHSGSRGVGESVLDEYTRRFGHKGVDAVSEEGLRYLKSHDNAWLWAVANRRLIGERLLEQLCAESVRPILDVCHNNVVAWPDGEGAETDESSSPPSSSRWLHRKGAAPSDRGTILIPGSRGSFSYLVMPLETEYRSRGKQRGVGGTCNADGVDWVGDGVDGVGDGLDGGYRSGWSLAHGAGRKIARSTALAAGKSKYPQPKELNTTAIGSRVVCEDKDLMYEEVPEAYKEIGSVIADLVEAKLCEVIAVMRPVLTYKTRAKLWG